MHLILNCYIIYNHCRYLKGYFPSLMFNIEFHRPTTFSRMEWTREPINRSKGIFLKYIMHIYLYHIYRNKLSGNSSKQQQQRQESNKMSSCKTKTELCALAETTYEAGTRTQSIRMELRFFSTFPSIHFKVVNLNSNWRDSYRIETAGRARDLTFFISHW